MKILAIIPARGGSQGIKNKNIRNFSGQPLISHTIKVAKKSKFINRLVVSTNDLEIAKISKKYGAEIPVLRPLEISGSTSKVADAIVHMLDFLKNKENYIPDYLVLLQTTSPLRETVDVDGAISLLLSNKKNANATVSVCVTEPLLYIVGEKGHLKLVSSEDFLKTTNRQELPKTYKLDGSMVYVVKTPVFLKLRTFLPPRTLGYVVPRWRAIDLDEPEDFVTGEIICKNKTKIKNKINKFP